MARRTTQYVCQDCGSVFGKWAGRCDGCGAWNSIVEEAVPSQQVGKRSSSKKSAPLPLVALTGGGTVPDRLSIGIAELDRACGGGLVPGSALLIGGDPGIGKSTALLQATAALAKGGHACIYVSGEEAIDQLRLRAHRLGLADADVLMAAETNVETIIGAIDTDQPPAVMVIDSIQTMFLPALESAPGTVAQVRACAHELIGVAKRRGMVLILVGHVTKEGQIAGPRVLEHMVDTVLYFEGDRGHQFRILRAVKNRFGAADEIGVFEMTDGGLMEVANPSALFLGDRDEPVSGTAVFPGIEGSRPVLVEFQALVAPSSMATPRRAVVGWDSARLAMVLAVLEARCGISFAGRDVYLSVAGGLRVVEPAADLAAAAALMSSMADHPLPAGAVVFGEIGLSGQVRPVGQVETRLKEAQKLGFDQAWMPARAAASSPSDAAGMGAISRLAHVRDLLERIPLAPNVKPDDDNASNVVRRQFV